MMQSSSITQQSEQSYSFHLPTRIEFGFGKASILGGHLAAMGVKQAFIVSDQGVVSAGLLSNINASLQEAGISSELYLEVEPDPSFKTIDRGADCFRKSHCDVLIAVGGGSVMDTAKGIRIVAQHGQSIGDYAGVERIKSGSVIPLVAVPTTSGTGSEVTIFGVYSDWENQVKVTVNSRYMAPTLAIVDPELTLGLPKKITASTGIDALAHGIETYFSRRASPATDALATEAIATIGSSLRAAVENGHDKAARTRMSHGSLLAGMAFNNGLLGLAHAIGSALSGHCHVPHGIAIGLLLPHVIEFNAGENVQKAANIANLLGIHNGSSSSLAAQAAEAVAQLVSDIGLPTRLRDVDVSEHQLGVIALDSFKSGMMKWNPKQPSEAEVLELLKKIY
ncbi:iron-containing alcohol dehydrogenase family protein [Fictibacillus enclensis]|nr:iron-containing alcohol dehydrogenase [Fictibacillus enclensis]